MPRDHFIPATYMAGLSNDTNSERRNRKLWTMRRDRAEPFEAKAGSIGRVKDLYSLMSDTDNRTVDDTWTAYEGKLARAIGALEDPSTPLDANIWLRTLVPFVASLFVRGRDFAERYRSRVPDGLLPRITDDAVNNTRLFELQRLLAPVTAARWVVLHHDSRSHPFIGNELGLAGCVDPYTRERGWVFPLSSNLVLMIYPKTVRKVLAVRHGKWVACIEHHAYIPEQTEKMNLTIAQASQEFIYGPSKDSVWPFRQVLNRPPTPLQITMQGWPFASKALVAHEFDWHRLAGITTKGLNSEVNEINLQELDFKALSSGWCPRISFPASLPEFRSGLSFDNGYISLELGPRPFPGDAFRKRRPQCPPRSPMSLVESFSRVMSTPYSRPGESANGILTVPLSRLSRP